MAKLIYSSHLRWPLPPSTHSPTFPTLRISVLDSSFNPPTLAHLALANFTPPAPRADYHARLLLLSSRNADKTLMPGDPSFSQRLDMMLLLSHHVTNTPDNVAVAIIDEPTFVGKSTQLLSFLKQRFVDMTDKDRSVQLTFILGTDTLERLFTPRYYGSEEQMRLALRKFFSPPPEGDDSYAICAHRAQESFSGNAGVGTSTRHAHEFMGTGRVVMIDIGTKESTYSSTAVRSRIKSGDSSWQSYVTDDIAQYIIQNGLYIHKALG